MDHSELRSRITDVKFEGFDDPPRHERLSFNLDGISYTGKLKGRNRDLCLGHTTEADQAIALRVLVDGDATKEQGE